MNLRFVIMHQDCPAVLEGRSSDPPKFSITDFSEDRTQTRLRCAFCDLELTLTCHTADNPSHTLSPHTGGDKDESHGAERPHELHPAG